MAMLNLFGGKKRIKKQKRKIAKTVQQSIPIDAIYKDGIFRTGRLFSKSWKFSDINYAVASDDDQLQMFLAHSAILNGLPTDAMAEITIYNRQLHSKVFEQITTPSDNPNYKKYTQELNGILCDKMSESNNIVHEKYITVATEKKNIEEARTFFTRVGNDLTADYAKISSKIAELGYITITTKTKDEMIAQYNFTRKQQEALNTLLEQDEVLISATQSLAVSDATAQDILKNLPDSLSAERKKVIKAACSLVGKVNYFWGGKSSAIGWDSEWGKLKTVSAEGSKTTGTKRPFGLDCSGFVTWSFINSGFNASAIGHGTQGQIAKCSRISWNSAQAGDLAFYGDLSHVGIIAGKDTSGNILVIHCSSSRNNVVITTNSGFGFAARPSCY